MMFYIKIYKREGEVLLAACDKEILGKKLSEGEYHLDVRKEFYGDELIGVKEFVKLLSNVTIANLTGNKVVETAIKLGFINKKNVLTISGIRHAQIVAMTN